jgi:hypothetical protein
MTPGRPLFELAVEAGRRIAAARLHLAEGFRALDDARRRFADPLPSVEGHSRATGANRRLIGATCPESRSKRPPGFSRSVSTSSALHAEEHGENPWTILSLNDPKK